MRSVSRGTLGQTFPRCSRLKGWVGYGTFPRGPPYLRAWEQKPLPGGQDMSSGGNALNGGTTGKNGKKRRRRIIWGSIALIILLGAGFGVKAALSPSHDIDPSKLANVERGDLARVVVATRKIQPLSKAEIKSKASGIVKQIFVDYGDRVRG